MQRAMLLTVIFLLGAAVGAVAAKKGADPSMFLGQDQKDAGLALLEAANELAENGSWENIAVGRAYYLGGMQEKGQAIFDAVTARKQEGSDWMRIGRVYWEAGDWDKAQEAFQKALQMSPKDAPWMAEVGGYYNIKGDRDEAERLFRRSVELAPKAFWNVVNMGGSYFGVSWR